MVNPSRFKPKPIMPSILWALKNTGFTEHSAPSQGNPAVFSHTLAPALRLAIAPSPRTPRMLLVQFTEVPEHLAGVLVKQATVMQQGELSDLLGGWEALIKERRPMGPPQISFQ